MEWVFLILLSALFLAFKDIITKNCLKQEHTYATLFWKSLIICCACLVVFNKNIDFIIPYPVLFLLIFKAAILSLAWYFLFQALKRLHISIVEPLINVSPLFLLILSFFILGERLSPIQYVGVGIIMIGAYLLGVEDIRKPFGFLRLFKNKNVTLLLVALFLVSISAVLDKIILVRTTIPSTLFYCYLFVSIIYLVIIISHGYLREIMHPVRAHYYLIILMAFLTFVADVSYFVVVAMPLVPISLIIPLKRLSTLIGTVIGGQLFQESGLFHKAAACGVMLFGIFLIF